MSFAELKATAEQLTAKERAWMRAFLFAKERGADFSWKQEMAQRRRRLLAGRGISDTEYRRRMRSVAAKPTVSSK